MWTSVERIVIRDCSERSLSGQKTVSIRTNTGQLKSHFLRSLLEADVVLRVPRDLMYELVTDIQKLGVACDEVPFPEPNLAGDLRWALKNPKEELDLGLVEDLLKRRVELQASVRAMARC